jgi:uncharacterized protein (TIGR02757 family)
VARAHRPTPELPGHLNSLYNRFPFERSLAQDPIAEVRPVATHPRAAEIAGLLAATLAIGNTTAIRRAFREVHRRVGDDLVEWVEGSAAPEAAERLRSFRHRWVRGEQLTQLARTVRSIYSNYTSVEELFLDGYTAGGFAGGLSALAHRLRVGPDGNGTSTPRGYANLFPSPFDRSRSACKRLTLYTRWMTRTGFPDLGIWQRLPTGELRIPLDQHVYWIAYHLGLTARRTRNWATVEEVTEALRRIDPIDPVRFDFVLCHTGISGDCPKQRDMTVCGPCLVRPDCLLWRGRGGVAA